MNGSVKKRINRNRTDNDILVPIPPYVSRDAWNDGNNIDAETLRLFLRLGTADTESYTDEIRHIAIHYMGSTRTPSENTNWNESIYRIRREHVREKDKLYSDIGYHWAIAPDGTIIQGRIFSGLEETNIRGSNVKARNTGVIGILMLSETGFFEDEWLDYKYI